METIIDYRGKTPRKTSFGIPLITAKVVKGGRIETPDEFIAVEDYQDWMRRGIPKPGDVVITTEAPLGEVAQLGTERVALAQRLIALRGNPEILDNQFLKFLMQSNEVQDQLRARASGTTVLGIKQSELRKVMLTLPSIAEQRSIGRTLGALDDKIELNRRIRETLEATVKSLFESWFVDFDPVRARAEGRDSSLPQRVADLFPNSFDASELGEVPSGWRVTPLGEMISAVKGRSYKSEELIDSDTALVTLKSFARGGGYRAEGLKPFAGAYKPEQVVKPGEIVIACTDVTQAAEVIGRAAIVRGSARYRTLVASLDTLIVRPRDQRLSRAFLYFLGSTEAFVAHTYAHTTGTTVLHLAKEAVPSFRYAVPPVSVVEAFDAVAAPAVTRIELIEGESETLATLRDTLLPKLISGTIRVADASQFSAPR
jgi:type I restriction enzyme S subunit